jgi:hypothetical protein
MRAWLNNHPEVIEDLKRGPHGLTMGQLNADLVDLEARKNYHLMPKEGVAEGGVVDAVKKGAKKAWDYATEPVDAPNMDTYKKNRARNIADIRKKKQQGVEEAHPNSKIYDKCWDGYKKVPGKKRGEAGSCVKESALWEAVSTARPKIKKVSRKRADNSLEVRYHVLDSNGVTHKVFDDAKFAKQWMNSNRDLLDKE